MRDVLLKITEARAGEILAERQMFLSQKNPSGRRLIFFICCFAFFALIFFVYARVLSAPFLWDDEYLIGNNPALRSAGGLLKAMASDLGACAGEKWNFFRPLHLFSLAANYSFCGLDPFGYHATNVFLHGLTSLLLGLLFWVLFRRILLACLAGLFFSVHPLHTEAVAYISGRADILSLFFICLALICYLQGLSRRGFIYDAGLFFCFVLALLAKESSLIFPVLCLITHVVTTTRPSWRKLFWMLAAVIFYASVRYLALGIPSLSQHGALPFMQRCAGFFAAVATYVRLLFFPWPLHMEYGLKAYSFRDPVVMAGVGVFAGLVVLCLSAAKKRPVIFFGCCWFLIGLLPVSNFIPLNAAIAEHWLYLPSAGFFLVVAALWDGAFDAAPRRTARRTGLWAAAGLLVVCYAMMTAFQLGYWRDPRYFYERTLVYAPDSPRIYNQLGILDMREQRYEEARQLFEKALQMSPRYAKVYNNLGQYYRQTKRPREALDFYWKAIALKEDYAPAYNNLCQAYADLGRYKDALPACRRALELDPDSPEALSNMGGVYYRLGEKLKAQQYFVRAVEGGLPSPEALNNLGVLFLEKGDYASAENFLRESLRLRPSDAQTHNNLAMALVFSGRPREAVGHFERAIALDPSSSAAWVNLALTYTRLKEFEKAAFCYQEARKLGYEDPTL